MQHDLLDKLLVRPLSISAPAFDGAPAYIAASGCTFTRMEGEEVSREETLRQIRELEAARDLVVKPARESISNKLQSLLRIDRIWSGHFGATGIDPKHLAIYFVVPTRAQAADLLGSATWKEVCSELRSLLAAGGYPVESLQDHWVGCYSQQACDEEYKGNWYHFFK